MGYVELKGPRRRIPPDWSPSSHERKQWEQLRLLPNVLYSNGNDWALFRNGELVGSVARLVGDIRRADAKLAPADGVFEQVISEFLLWTPPVPRNVHQLVRAIANLCRLLREEVCDTLRRERTGDLPEDIFTGLAQDWRTLLFPGLSDQEFADGYAQTVTFALLLARVDGITFEHQPLAEIAKQLGKKHSLMGKALSVLTEKTFEGRSVVISTLLRVIGAVDWDIVSQGRPDTALHLYEPFLQQYDPELRRQSGWYYTPNEAVSFMVSFVEEILRKRLGKSWGLATAGVEIIDPAVGTGTYLLNILESVARTIEDEEGPAAVPAQLRALFSRMTGFEKQTGPIAVAELRLHQALKAYSTEIPESELELLVTDTLDSPYEELPYIPRALEPIARSRRRAGEIKRLRQVLVIMGNPPYGERAGGRGGWVEKGGPGQTPVLDAFRAPGNGRYEYVLSNLYVYFWRWATWKVFDAHPDAPSGIVAFISPSSFTTGRGHAGMREYLRRTADECWVIDLSPERHQPDVITRVFPGVQHRLCITIVVRSGAGDRDQPAPVRYMAVEGRRSEKFAKLKELHLENSAWMDCPTDWQAPFLPSTSPEWQSYPYLGDLVPWSHSGLKPNRNWVHSPDSNTLRRRWMRLLRADPDEKPVLMKETRDRDLSRVPAPLPGTARHAKALKAETSPLPCIERVALRSFDRQYLIYDARVIDFVRPPLWYVRGSHQIYATEQHAHAIDAGPGIVFSALVPSVHHYNGRGGRVLPLYRDAAGRVPNLAPGLLDLLSCKLHQEVSAKDIFAYIAAVTAHPAYTERFAEQLRTPGVRVPLTADPQLWGEAMSIGHRVIRFHTYGERPHNAGEGYPHQVPRLPASLRPKVVRAIPDTPQAMPGNIAYDKDTETLLVGDGQIRPVPPRVWEYEISGMKVVRKWFDYRKKHPGGKHTSPLDDITPERWPAQFTTELLELLNMLGLCVGLETEQARLLDQISTGPLITTTDLEHAGVLPVPQRLRKPPQVPVESALPLFEAPS
ncbi:type ISP restriction/modification enzyme [Actinoallomurus acaciae]|uniref:site-specific DNA-methyltransferase (adenine-specific) n=1 Tax=Actinoallomurus acaciae TaxID=502577 RepID=A0ABV5YK03_9ACTN